MNETQQIYEKEYIPYSIKWGRLTSLIGVAASFFPVIILSFVFKIVPAIDAIVAAATIRISACLVYYFIEPISFQPVLGIPATYMAFLSGNLSNLRVPCSSVAQKAAGVEEGTPQGAVLSTIGVAVSIVVNLAILTLGDNGRGNGTHAQLNPEALRLQICGNGLGGLHLSQARFRIIPDPLGQVDQCLLPGIHRAEIFFFICLNH